MASTEDPFTTPQGAESAGSGSSNDSAQEHTGDVAAAPAKRPRRATKKASAPKTGSSAEVEGAQAAASQGDGPEAGSEAAPARARTAKKAAKKTTRKAAASSSAAGQTADTGAAAPSTEGAEAARPAKKAAKKTTRKAATTSTKAAKAAESTDQSAAQGTDDSTGTSSGTSGGTSAADEQDASTATGAAAFGVLFQAPDPEAAKPRRTAKKAKARTTADEGAEQPAGTPKDSELTDSEQPDSEQSESGPASDQAEAEESEGGGRRRRRRGGKGRGKGRSQGEGDADTGGKDDQDGSDAASGDEAGADEAGADEQAGESGGSSSSRRRRRRRRSGSSTDGDDPPGTVTKVRESRRDEPQSVKGSTRLEAKKQRRREGREAGRRRTVITEAEFLARRESVDRVMVVRERDGRTQIGVLEDDVLVEHYVSRETNASMAGNVYLGRVQNVLPSMEAAFVDIGKGRNAVLYAGEVNWDAAGLDSNQPKRIENALKSGDTVLVQVTKDPIGHKGARLTSQVSLPGRYLVYVPEGSMTGISRKLPDTERSRLKGILKEVLPDSAGVIVRTAAEGASEEELRADVERLTRTWDKIRQKAESKAKAKGGAPTLVHGEPDLTVRVIRDVFNEDFGKLVVAGDQAWSEVSDYLGDVAPDLAERLEKWTSEEDLFTHYRVDEQIAKAMDRKVWLPSGGSLVIDRTEAMTVIDVNTGKFVGSGGNLEETVTKNNIEAAEEIVRQLRLRDIGGIIVIDFIDMVLESNRDLVVRRLLECLGRDRTKHQVAEVTSLGLVQMTRKRVGSGLIEVFSETCEACGGRGIIVHADPVEKGSGDNGSHQSRSGNGGGASRGGRRGRGGQPEPQPPAHSGPTPAQIAAAAHAAAVKSLVEHPDEADLTSEEPAAQDQPVVEVHEAQDQEQPAAAAPATEDLGTRAPVTPAAAPEQEVPEQEVPAPRTTPVEQEAPSAPALRRRKRGRVVAPAGPPRHGGETADADPAADRG